MIQELLTKFLLLVVAAIFLLTGVLVVFLVNARFNLKRKLQERQRILHILSTAQNMESTEKAAELLGMNLEDFTDFCRRMNIELPEARLARIETQKRKKDEELKRIMDEETAWRIEQEKLNEERLREKELEAKKRRDRLRKFGIS
jgi:hypothetical protein